MWLLIATCLLAPAHDPQGPVSTGREPPPALAAEPPAATPVAAPVDDQPDRAFSTEEKIEAWRRSGDSEAETQAEALTPDRGVHGEVSGWIGSDGARGASVVISAPVGKAGSATVAVSKSEGRRFADPMLIEPRPIEP